MMNPYDNAQAESFMKTLKVEAVGLVQLSAKPLQGRAGHLDPALMSGQITTSPKVRWMSMPITCRICASLASDKRRERRATRQLRIRALGATGRVAEAASY
jgi:hypothetical protein